MTAIWAAGIGLAALGLGIGLGLIAGLYISSYESIGLDRHRTGRNVVGIFMIVLVIIGFTLMRIGGAIDGSP